VKKKDIRLEITNYIFRNLSLSIELIID